MYSYFLQGHLSFKDSNKAFNLLKWLLKVWGNSSAANSTSWASIRIWVLNLPPMLKSLVWLYGQMQPQCGRKLKQEDCWDLLAASLAPVSIREPISKEHVENGRTRHLMSFSGPHSHMHGYGHTYVHITHTYTMFTHTLLPPKLLNSWNVSFY